MKFVIAFWLAVALLCFAPPATRAEEMLSCEEYLANASGSRSRIVGTFLWVALKGSGDLVTPNAAGTLIANIDTMRAMVDVECAKGGPMLVAVTKVVPMFLEAALTDPEIR